MSTTIIDELIVRLGLDSKSLVSKGGSADKTLRKLEGSGKAATASVDGLSSAFTKMLAVIGGAYAIKAFVEDTIASSAALDRLSKNLGISVRELSAWGNAVEEVGGSAKGLQGTMSMLSAAQTELRLTGQSHLIPYFAALGVAFAGVDGKARPVNDILLDLADRFSHLDRPTANNLGKMMGIDQDTLNLLLQGRREVELMISRQKQFNAVSKEQAEESAKLQKSLVNLRQSFTALGRDLLQSASPALEKFLGVLTNLAGWAQNNKDFLKDLAVILGTVAAGLTLIAVATSPITLTIAGIIALAGAIALLWQDYQNWKRGGDSFIDWEKWKPGIDAAIAGVKDLAKTVKDSFGVMYYQVSAYRKMFSGDWKGAAADQKMADELTLKGVKDTFHAVGVVAKAVPAEHRAFVTGNGQSVSSAYAIKYFQDRGLSSSEAIGLASQIHSESNGKVNAVGDNGKAYGLIQFHADRQENFRKFAGKDIRSSSADDQLAFMIHELQTTERAAGLRLKGASSAKEAAEIASKYYVRPADREGEASRRGSYAAQIAGVQGAGNAARAAGGAGNASSSTSNDHSVSVQTGPITIHTQATDANGISKDLAKSFGYAFTAQAASGLN